MFSGEDDTTIQSLMILKVEQILYPFNKNSTHWFWGHGIQRMLLVKPRLIRNCHDNPFLPTPIQRFSDVLNRKLAVLSSTRTQNSISLLLVYKAIALTFSLETYQINKNLFL